MSTPTDKLEVVRKLLAKAEAEGVTPQEAEALSAKASELMAKYGIDEAMARERADRHEKPGSRIFDIDNPWGQVKAHLLAQVARSQGCQCVLLTTAKAGARIHVFGFESDIATTDMLYTSLLLQMASAHRRVRPPQGVRSVKAWNRSWLLGWVSAVAGRLQAARAAAEAAARAEETTGGPSTELVLADRSVAVKNAQKEAYPQTRSTRITYSGRGYGDGYAQGQRANIHNRAGVGTGGRALTGSR